MLYKGLNNIPTEFENLIKCVNQPIPVLVAEIKKNIHVLLFQKYFYKTWFHTCDLTISNIITAMYNYNQ